VASRLVDYSAVAAAFYALTRKGPLDEMDAFRVFCRAVDAAANPTPKNRALFRLVIGRHQPPSTVLRAMILDELERNKLVKSSTVRETLAGFDGKFEKLTDGQIEKALERRNWNARLAEMALRVGALEAKRRDGEDSEAAIQRICNAGRMVATREKKRRKKR
jgi:hypothetical protein